MTTLRTVRLTLLACLSLWPMVPLAAAASIEVTSLGMIAPPLNEDEAALLNRMVSSANFTLTDPSLFKAKTTQLHAQLIQEGFRNAFNTNMVSYTISGWYSPALNRSLICVEEQSDVGYQHLAYYVEGRVSQHDPVMY